jgi:AcrR family transcriptional regulator
MVRTCGRVRSADARDAVLAATLRLLEESGYGGITIEKVAARSGVAKSTIYRWWDSRAVLVMDAYQQAVDRRMPEPDTGDVAADLTTFLTGLYRVTEHPVRVRVLRGLMAEAQLNPDFEDAFRSFVRHRQAVVEGILRRAVDRGDLPAGIDIGHAVDLIFGPFWYRLLVGHRPLDSAEAPRHVADLLHGLMLTSYASEHYLKGNRHAFGDVLAWCPTDSFGGRYALHQGHRRHRFVLHRLAR